MTDAALTAALQNRSPSKNWMAVLRRGIIACVLAVLAWMMPAQAVASLTILFGCALTWILFTTPVGSVLALGWLFGSYAAIFGATMILLALKLKKLDASDSASGTEVSA